MHQLILPAWGLFPGTPFLHCGGMICFCHWGLICKSNILPGWNLLSLPKEGGSGVTETPLAALAVSWILIYVPIPPPCTFFHDFQGLGSWVKGQNAFMTLFPVPPSPFWGWLSCWETTGQRRLPNPTLHWNLSLPLSTWSSVSYALEPFAFGLCKFLSL